MLQHEQQQPPMILFLLGEVCLSLPRFYPRKIVKISFAPQLNFIYLHALGRLAQLVQSTSFTPRGSGVRIPQRPHQSKSQCIALGFFVFKKEESFILVFFKTKNVHEVHRIVFAGVVDMGTPIPQRPTPKPTMLWVFLFGCIFKSCNPKQQHSFVSTKSFWPRTMG